MTNSNFFALPGAQPARRTEPGLIRRWFSRAYANGAVPPQIERAQRDGAISPKGWQFLKLRQHAIRTVALAAIGASALGLHPAAAAPSTTHPRLWITTADIPRLQSWAVATNPMYKNGLQAAALSGKTYADAHWNWVTGTPDSKWHDTGSTNWEGDATEAYAQMFAFMALIDPVAANRAQWQLRAHAMLMWAINQAAVNGPGQKFGDTAFSTYNRANYWGEAWGLTVDWIYDSFTAAEKANIRKVFLKWGNAQLNASTAGEEHPQPVGVLNDLQLLGSSTTQTLKQQQEAQLQLRWAANNYFLGHMRNMAMMALSFDPADDAGASTTVGSSLSSLVSDVIGAWLYQAYAVFEDAATVKTKLAVPPGNHSLGIASGGLPVEGSLYGESQAYLLQTLLALKTAGYSDTAAYGPQVGLIDSPYWGQSVTGYLNSVTPTAAVPASLSYLGPVYGQAEYGDVLNSFVDYEHIDLIGLMAMLDRTGNPTRYAKDRWIATNMLQGGSAALYSRASAIWGNSNASYALMYFMGFDPAAAAPADPRPATTPQFIAPSIGRILARSDWTPNASWFTFRCGWESINHQGGDCGEFEFYRKGQWLTKEWAGYANDWMAYTPLYHNTLSIQNTKPADGGGSLYAKTVQYGGQWNNGGSNGDPAVNVSVNDNWAYAFADATNLYNRPSYWSPQNAAQAVTRAQRSIVWLNPDHIVVYDRVNTTKAGLFRKFNLVLLTAPTINGNTMTEVVGNQQLTVQALAPNAASIAEQHFWTTSPSSEFNLVAQLEPATDRIVITDTAAPARTRFLTVLQGTDKGVAADPAKRIVSSAGTPYEGAVFGNTAVLFAANPPGFSSLTYSVPSSVTRHVITGLAPKAGYNVATALAGASTSISITPGGTVFADAAGVLGIGLSASVRVPQAGGKQGWLLAQPE